jgi:hypothetical protein
VSLTALITDLPPSSTDAIVNAANESPAPIGVGGIGMPE